MLEERKGSIRLKREKIQTEDPDEELSKKKRAQLRKDNNKFNNHCAEFFFKLRDGIKEDY